MFRATLVFGLMTLVCLPFPARAFETPDYFRKSYISISLFGGPAFMTGDSGAPFQTAPCFGAYLLGDIDASFSLEGDFLYMNFPIDSARDIYSPPLASRGEFGEGSLRLYLVTGGVRFSYNLQMSPYGTNPFFLPYIYMGMGAVFSGGSITIPSDAGRATVETLDAKFATDLTAGFDLKIHRFLSFALSLKLLWSPAIDRDEVTGDNGYRNVFILSPLLNFIVNI